MAKTSILLVGLLALSNLCWSKTLPIAKAGCSFNLNNNSPAWPPHLIDTNKKIVLPTLQGGSRVINLVEGQSVNVACLGTGNTLLVTGSPTNDAVCAASGKLLIGTVEYSYNQLGCQSQNKEVLRETTTCAGGSGALINVGWEFNGDFIRLFDMCHNKEGAFNYYALSDIIGWSVDANDTTNQRPSFSTGGYYPGIDVNTMYTQVQQTITIGQIVGSEQLANQYVVPSTNRFLARGHLAPDGDFIDAASQDASYYFMNVAPQWQIFNAGSWLDLENAARDVATSRRIDLKIWTGTFGVTTLADINGVQQPIYLDFDANNNGLLPVPKYFWKVVHDPASNTATAFLGINNPHLSSVLPEDIICPNVCNQVPWVDWTLTSITRGYMFCCTTGSLKAVIDFAPDLDVPLLV